MSCKFHTFRDDLIYQVFRELKILAATESYSSFYAQKKSFGKIYHSTYTKYYIYAPQNSHLLEMLGLNLDALIVTFWYTFEDAHMTWADFEDKIGIFIETQFDTMLDDKYGFFCCCFGLKTTNPPCPGDGTCLAICSHICECVSQDQIQTTSCTCDHGYFCPVTCMYNCPRRRCKNYDFCNNELPQWLYNINGGLCTESCRWRYGPLKRLISEEECPICNDKSESVEIICGHRLCFTCWQRITYEINIKIQPPKCPFCRHPVWSDIDKNVISES